MPRYLEQVIRTYVSTDPSGLPHEWEIQLDIPDNEPQPFCFRARGWNGSFIPQWVSVSRHDPPSGTRDPGTIAIEVRSTRTTDHAALDAIAELLDDREWNGADDLDAIAALRHRTGPRAQPGNPT